MSEMNNETRQYQSQTTQDDLSTELNRLGENLGKLLKSAWESDERRSVEREIKSGLDQFTKQIDSALEQTRADQNVKKARATIKDAWETAHGPQVMTELHLGLVDSLKKLNDELAKRVEAKPAHEVKVEETTKPAEEVMP
jgi:ElaB/YqjD/DUF883 family membrane-anchored ribosome-binding protein